MYHEDRSIMLLFSDGISTLVGRKTDICWRRQAKQLFQAWKRASNSLMHSKVLALTQKVHQVTKPSSCLCSSASSNLRAQSLTRLGDDLGRALAIQYTILSASSHMLHDNSMFTGTLMQGNCHDIHLSLASEIVVAACPKDRVLRVIDVATGTTYSTFGDTAASGLAPVRGTQTSEGLGTGGDYVISSQLFEQALVFHRWGKAQPLLKCRVSESVGPVVTTPDGFFLLAGGRSGQIYAWEIASGSLVANWDAHYKAISCMVMTSDGGFLITGSEDTTVRAWALSDILAAERTKNDGTKTACIRPFCSWSNHSLPVTGLHCGQGGPTCRIVSCSLDHRVHIYELANKDGALCTLQAPSGVACTSLDPGEKHLLVGGTMGDIFVIDMDVVCQARTASRTLVQFVGTVGPIESSKEDWRRLAGHQKAVMALTFTWDGRIALSASEDGSLRWWHMDSRQCVRRVTFDNGGPLTGLLLLPRPAALLHVMPKVVLPAPLQPLKKYGAISVTNEKDDLIFLNTRTPKCKTPDPYRTECTSLLLSFEKLYDAALMTRDATFEEVGERSRKHDASINVSIQGSSKFSNADNCLDAGMKAARKKSKRQIRKDRIVGQTCRQKK